ncbi:uncharacterized protein LOC131686833 [Topomyia yanbarensis]|uniref:uncharacterized protein LOC131686833 n=1 Tax=Topomyia yanbarensis TaxID=2498891 RepID=UPI00273BA97A|nr:uncharacterized protein LOC131686833 [Topomyia yanbarensis]
MEYKLATKHASGGQFGREHAKGRGAMYYHSEEENLDETANVERTSFRPCKVCQCTDHRLRHCAEFKKLRYVDRLKVVNHWKLCCVCLNDHSGRCGFKIQCNVGECRERHNPLMHPVNTVVGISAHIWNQTKVMFRMIPAQLHFGGRSITVLAFLDEGASVTLIEKRMADRLGLVGVPEKLTIKWTADITRVEKDSSRMNVWASAVGSKDKVLLHTVRTVENLMLPHQKLDSKEIATQFKHMRGLPIASYDGQPGILIGLNNVHSFVPLEAKIGATAEPIAVKCKLGWTVYGPRQSNTAFDGGYMGYHHEVSNEALHDLLKSHYALEESVVAVAQESAEDKRAREIMERTTKRVGNRFETGLLWRTDDPQFPDSFPMALHRMKQLEKKLERNPELHKNVCRQIEEFQQKGYAHLATAEELIRTETDKVWYLPLNVVTNPRKPGKVRLVWDAAASVQGVSLNTQLLTGPDLLIPLVQVIVGFRERRIAFGGDLREMYHQVKIVERDRQAQRFVFRKNFGEKPSIFVMDVATFGSTCSPSSAQYIKNKNAEEHAVQYPEAAAAIIHRHYVDDYFDSVDTVEEAINRAMQVRTIHKNGGFEIRNWVSNVPEVLRMLGEEKQVTPVHFGRDKQSCSERVLGIIWDPNMDEFSFSTLHRPEMMAYLCNEKRPTKQIALSCVMGFFDPMGLLSPFTIHGKIIIQHLWRLGCDWKQEIDDESWRLWKRWTGLLPEVDAVRITRCYLGNAASSAVESLELHIFTDASEHAYGCVAYLRAVINGNVRCSLVMSRAKVAPLKRQSIPRWLQSDQYKFKQFIAFRVGEILELTRVIDWRWLPTKLNIADVLTKWGSGPPLSSDGEWFNGKSFLYYPEEEWPSKVMPFEETSEEARGVVLFQELIDVKATSRWMALVRVTASVVRFIANCRQKKMGQPIVTSKATETQQRSIKSKYLAIVKPLQQEELLEAETILWKQAQFDSFPDEMSALTKNLNLEPGQMPSKIQRSSTLVKLTPILDDEGVLRMGGRFEKSDDISFDQKFPIILARQHDITKKLIQCYHERFGHANRETVCNELRQKFWIPNIRAAIMEVMRECMWCKVHRCRPQVPMMAPLPTRRIRAGIRPFSSVGLDYLGPVDVSVGRRKEKRWVAVFTCLAIRAVHLEVVNSLTTQSCLMAIRRFSCKRGAPDIIFSDNATCFKGANNEMLKTLHGDCEEEITTARTAWRFIPPGTPHMGGAWERMVRSVKEAMKALEDGRKLTDEILVTTLAEAEDMINTRPLTYMPQASAENEALTPNHFLRGIVKGADLLVDRGGNLAEALRDVYKRSQYLADRMWGRWSKEYLPTINRRTKWYDERKPLEAGDLVFVVDGKDRKNWSRGIVEEVVQGDP